MAENPQRQSLNRLPGRVLAVLLPLISVCYPLLWYWGRERGLFGWLALAMAAVWMLRAWWAPTGGQRAVAAVVAVFFAAAWLLNQPAAMYWYPVGMSGLMLLLFGGSLFTRQSLIERLARLREPDLPAAAVAYTRRVTQVWCAFFVFNGGVAAALVLAQAWQAWAWYTGVLAYVLMGVLFVLEWLCRRRLRHVHGAAEGHQAALNQEER